MNKSLARFKNNLSIRGSHRDSDYKLAGVIYVYFRRQWVYFSTGILSQWKKFSDENSVERTCEIEVLVENGTPVTIKKVIRIPYRNIRPEPYLQVKSLL